jgi:hypothetical protein
MEKIQAVDIFWLKTGKNSKFEIFCNSAHKKNVPKNYDFNDFGNDLRFLEWLTIFTIFKIISP